VIFRAPRQLLRRSQTSSKDGVVCTAMDSSFGGSEPAQPIFPRIDVRDPYKRLGVSREASEEEIREAHNYLSNLVPFYLFSLLLLISSISKKSCNSGFRFQNNFRLRVLVIIPTLFEVEGLLG
jgi:hypothetical protein